MQGLFSDFESMGNINFELSDQ